MDHCALDRALDRADARDALSCCAVHCALLLGPARRAGHPRGAQATRGQIMM